MNGELRAVPVGNLQEMEFEAEVVIKRYGIDAEAWLEPAHFFLESEGVLRVTATGRRIWKGKVAEREAIAPSLLGLSEQGTGVNGTALSVCRQPHIGACGLDDPVSDHQCAVLQWRQGPHFVTERG